MEAPSTVSRSDAALVVHGSTASYHTGKLEAYFRAKGIAYRLESFSESSMRRCARHTGVVQIPQVECPDGSWLVDTTLIREHFERVRPHPAVTPREPVLAFVSRLIEDYADEWLWRPAMHYRWSFPETARLMSAWLAEHLAERRAPQWLKRRYWRHRQYGTFVRGLRRGREALPRLVGRPAAGAARRAERDDAERGRARPRLEGGRRTAGHTVGEADRERDRFASAHDTLSKEGGGQLVAGVTGILSASAAASAP
jgi:hypothetical protein